MTMALARAIAEIASHGIVADPMDGLRLTLLATLLSFGNRSPKADSDLRVNEHMPSSRA
jgi:hypothetical protein